MAAQQLAILAVALCCLLQCAAETRICLNMIMKDEKDNLHKFLPLVGPELSGWTICDTGSTDGSQDITKSFFKATKVPGTLLKHAWKDFAANRNLCIQAGMKFSRSMAKQQGMPQGAHFCDYLWFLDVDQFLHVPPDTQPGQMKAMNLTKPVYYMVEKSPGYSYQNIRLASTAVDWEWVGEVHEYVRRRDGAWNDRNDEIVGYWLEHDASGGNDGKRFVRDEQILSRVVQERPNDPRAHFYLGNTYNALNRKEDAIRHFIKRIQLGSWEEERFMAAHNLAKLVQQQYEAGEPVSPQVQRHLSTWDAQLFSESAAVTQELKLEHAPAALHALNATDGVSLASLEQGNALVVQLRDQRKVRDFDTVIAAFVSAIQVLPYRPEPWAKLARFYRLERDDFERCYSYAAGGLAQGAPKVDALFLERYANRYQLLDEACACGYYVDRVLQQGQLACHQLEQRLVEDLALEPDHPDSHSRRSMLERARGNLGWYDKKGGCNEGSATCAWR